MRWMAPEILKGEPPLFESDVFSLGMCILEAMAGEEHDETWTSEMDGPVLSSSGISDLVGRMCCHNPRELTRLSFVVYELERLAANGAATQLDQDTESMTSIGEHGRLTERSVAET